MKLDEHVFFTFFCADSARALMESAVCTELTAEEQLFREGDPADRLYLVLDGRIRIVKEAPDGTSEALALIPAGGFFGEFAVLDGKPRSASAVADQPSRVAALERDLLLKKLRSGEDDSAIRLAAHTIERVRAANQDFVEHLIQKERMALLGRMLGTIVHDLRNPFAVITMASDFISRQVEDPSISEFCKMITDQIDRVVQMADEVLEFSRGGTVLRPAGLEVAELLAEFDALNRRYLESLGIRLQIESGSCFIRGDKARLMRVLQNLVYNAAELLTDQGLIRIRAEVLPKALVLHVADNGPGIPPEIQQSLFDAFVTQGKQKGLGLGLAITKSIVNAHHGEISFTTGPEGTEFHIRLPRPVEPEA